MSQIPSTGGTVGSSSSRHLIYFARFGQRSFRLGHPSEGVSPLRCDRQHLAVSPQGFLRFVHFHQQVAQQFARRADRAGRHGMFFRRIFMVCCHPQQAQRILVSMLAKRHPSPCFLPIDRHCLRPVRPSFFPHLHLSPPPPS